MTGSTGFLGSHLLESFISQGFDVSILIRSTSNTWRIDHLLEKVKVFKTDELNLSLIFKEFKPDLIVHTACSYGRRNESLADIVKSNLIFGIDLLQESINFNVKSFINTDSLLPRNLNNYSLSKAQFADWLKVHSSQIKIINFKIEHIYGIKDDKKKFIPWLVDEMMNGDGLINLTSGIQKRDFIYISDVTNAFNVIINKISLLQEWNEFDLGTNTFTEVREVIRKLATMLENKYNKIIVPRLNFGAIPYRDGDIMIPKLDNKKLVDLGWEAKVSIDDGLREILNYN